MKKRGFKMWKGMSAAVLALAVLAACSNNSAPTGSGASAQPAASGGGTDKPKEVNLRFAWWGAKDRHEATLKAIDLYMQKNPHVKISAEYADYNAYFEKLFAQLAGGTAPDVMQIVDRWFFDLTKQQELVIDLNTKKDLIKFDSVDPAFMKTQLYNGKAYGFPGGLQGVALVYNKDFFAKNNIPEDTKWTWDSIVEAGKKVHQQNPNQYLFSTDTSELAHLLRAYAKQLTGNQLVKDDFTTGFTKEDMTQMLTWVKNLFDSGATQPLAQSVLYNTKSQEDPKWAKGEFGMHFKFASLIPNYQKNINFQLGVNGMPQMPNAKDTGVFVGSTTMFAINSKTKNVDESAKFLNWLMNDKEAIQALGTSRGLSATTEGRKIQNEAKQVDPVVNAAVESALKTSGKFFDNGISQNQELDKILWDAIDKVGYSKATPQAAAEELVKLYENKLKDLKSQSK